MAPPLDSLRIRHAHLTVVTETVKSGPAPSADAELIARFHTSMLAEGLADTTIKLRMWAAHRIATFAGTSLLTVTVDQVRAWLAPHRKLRTLGTYHQCAGAVFSWLVAEGLRADNPVDAISAPRRPRGVPRPCSTIALHAMLGACRTDQDRALLLLAAYEGLRAHEVAKHRGEDLDLDAGTLTVTGKGALTSVLPLHPDVAAIAELMPATGWWFPSPRRPGMPVHPDAVSARVRRLGMRAGVAEHGAHPLRHWYGTNLVRSGTDLRTTQTLMRHASLATTEIYVEVADETRRAAVLRLPTLGDET